MDRRISYRAAIGLAVIALPLALLAAQRDVPGGPVASNSGEVRGVLVTDETTPRPVRHAIVTLTGDVPVSPSVVTDDDGRFVFGGLPAGRFNVTAKKAAYLPAAYGATRPGRAGTAISLTRDAHLQITVTMSRGAVITGVLTDRTGQPVAGVQVAALNLRAGGGVSGLFNNAEFVTTDDRGAYRIYGLMPSEYVVAATPRGTGVGEIGARSTSDTDAVLSELTRRGAGSTTAAGLSSPSRPAPPISAPSAVGFAPVYFPGTALLRDAAHVTIASGEERAGVDFPVAPVPVATVSGHVSGDVQNLAAVQISLIIGGPTLLTQLGNNPTMSHAVDADGRFTFSNMAPGPYRLTARATRGQSEQTGPFAGMPGRGGASGGGSISSMTTTSGVATGDFLYGVADIDVSGSDITDVSLTLQPGSTFSGRVVFDATTPARTPVDPTTIRVSISPPSGTSYSNTNGTIIGNTFSAVAPAPVRPDGSFEIANIGPGTYLLRPFLPADMSQGWWLRSAIVDGRDLLDSPLDFVLGVNRTDVVLTVTDKHNELSGALQTATGLPAPEYFVVVFPADRTLWRVGARRVQSTRPGTDGRYSFVDLPAGDYLLAALTDVDANEWQQPDLLDAVAPASVRIAIRDGGKTIQDLRVAK